MTDFDLSEREKSDFQEMLEIRGSQAGQRVRKVLWEVVRELRVPDDLSLLQEALPYPQKSILQVRHSHHQAARLVAQGLSDPEISLITGYSHSYIGQLRVDPMFMELVHYYSNNETAKFVDVMDRMRTLGMSTLDELQSRLEMNPESYSLRELMEQVELTLVKPMQVAARASFAQTPTSPVAINVKFVASENAGTVIEHQPAKSPSEHQPAKPVPVPLPDPFN